ncbi:MULTISPECIES: Crp/Fnr family transcriptional regulator [unclassified Pseudodesulfovibrio]|uniref:Crp/Fnr family transcriptional regulator n=1 Tax=unclassified Pseudodesulfovibrio TaxID=2661612 RepID=UPI000FEBB858|nr:MULTISPECIES: Crp/Fnr family transcriptional regulator [unclassified Pseudodesulfovibrio]MCJ2165321.1 Crp/Fnr family transcriptional regulator [Pseudodesulfovibrio sp. S3-i]RWU02479.1 Crp/Fnr family transcriptional regulator [Pseudodesulfovibrio sp. S3]
MKFSGVNLLDEIAKEELADLRAVFNRRTFAKDCVIYRPDEIADLVFVIAEGRVRVYLAYEDKEFTLGILGPGDLYATHAGCHIQALEETELLVTDVRSVKRCMTEVPLFTRTMVRVLGHILQNSFSIIGSLAFKDIYNRLMDYILSEARDIGVPEDGGMVLNLNLTIEQLAKLVGATRQTVSTLLNDMERAGLMEKRARGEYFIPDVGALEKAAGIDSE